MSVIALVMENARMVLVVCCSLSEPDTPAAASGSMPTVAGLAGFSVADISGDPTVPE